MTGEAGLVPACMRNRGRITLCKTPHIRQGSSHPCCSKCCQNSVRGLAFASQLKIGSTNDSQNQNHTVTSALASAGGSAPCIKYHLVTEVYQYIPRQNRTDIKPGAGVAELHASLQFLMVTIGLSTSRDTCVEFTLSCTWKDYNR